MSKTWLNFTCRTMGTPTMATILKKNEGDYRYKKHPIGRGVTGVYVAMPL